MFGSRRCLHAFMLLVNRAIESIKVAVVSAGGSCVGFYVMQTVRFRFEDMDQESATRQHFAITFSGLKKNPEPDIISSG